MTYILQCHLSSLLHVLVISYNNNAEYYVVRRYRPLSKYIIHKLNVRK